VRRLLFCVAIVGVALAALATFSPGTAGAQTASTRIRDVDTKEFPLVEVTASIGVIDPLQAPTIRLTENGSPMTIESVETLGSSRRPVDVVLALDVSNSMQGAPLEGAFDAARRFVTDLPPSVQVGVLTFAAEPRVLVEVTGDRNAVLEALASLPATTPGTALYEGVAAAALMFSSSAQRNIVLLTDGRDSTGGDPESAGRVVRRADATIFAVRLDEARTNDSILESLATRTSGDYVSAARSDLTDVIGALAGRLSEQYVIRYRTEAAPGSEVSVTVHGNGGADSARVRFPRGAAPSEGRAVGMVAWIAAAPWTLPILLLLWYVAIFAFVSTLLGGMVRTRRDRELAGRMMSVDAPARRPEETETKPSGTGWIPAPLAGFGERLAKAAGLSAALDRHLERAALPVRTGEFMVATLGAALVGALLGGLLFQNFLFALPFALVGGVVPFLAVSMAASRRAERLRGQLPDVLMVLASSLRAGHSFLQALDMVAKEVGDPAAQEFARAVTEIRLGRPVEDALVAMGERIRSYDFGWAVLAINIQRQVGGNLAEILENVAETIRERAALRRQIKALSAEGRLSVMILVALPPALALYISFVNPLYIATLFGTTAGLFLVGTSSFLMVLGFLWMRKIVNLHV
jgi:tight adherence protein B